MKSLFIAVFAICVCQSAIHAQTTPQESGATKVIQESERSTEPSAVSGPGQAQGEIPCRHALRNRSDTYGPLR